MKNKNGITLIALIITVIILLILAGVAISISVNGGDLFGKASQARENWNISVENENTAIKGVLDILNEIDTIPTSTENLISKELTTNGGNGYIGYYADFDGIPGVDGIIYADLLVQKPTSGQWKNSSGEYNIPTNVTAANVKDYVISETPVTDARFEKTGSDPSTYTARYVISPANSSSGTEARFYAMGLDDIKDNSNNDLLYWYYNAYNKLNVSDTLENFGAGETNTTTMLAKWNAGSGEGGCGAQDNKDMWKWVKAKREEYAGWFVPSTGEWSAFAVALNISATSTDTTYYGNFKLKSYYWTSTIKRTYDANYASLDSGIANTNVDNGVYVRLSAMF